MERIYSNVKVTKLAQQEYFMEFLVSLKSICHHFVEVRKAKERSQQVNFQNNKKNMYPFNNLI